MLSYAKRQEYWEWCREFIDREVIYRADKHHPVIPSKAPGGSYIWQFYSRRATCNPYFSYRLGALFWDHFQPIFEKQPFQICACLPSAPPIGAAIQSTASELGIKVNLFSARREPKSFGVHNWFDGRVLPDLPVLMVDDAAASTNYMLHASVRVQMKLNLPLHRNYFTLLNKVGRGASSQVQHTNNYLDKELVCFFTLSNFTLSAEGFQARYGKPPGWSGIVA